MKNKFRLNDNQLSLYAFVCGYIQELEINEVRIELYYDPCVWQLKGYDYKNGGRLFWDSFDSGDLTSARKEFFKKSKELFGLSKKETIEKLK